MSLLKDWFTKPNLVPLPLDKWKSISDEELPNGAVLTWFGGTKLTERAGERVYDFPYHPAPYHTSRYKGNGLTINVGPKTTIEPLRDTVINGELMHGVLRSSRCCVATIYKFLTPEQITKMAIIGDLRAASKDRMKNKYDWRGFCWPLMSRIPVINKLGFFKPKESDDYCTDEVVQAIEAVSGRSITGKDDELSYPWDVINWAEAHPDEVEIRVLHVGSDFKP